MVVHVLGRYAYSHLLPNFSTHAQFQRYTMRVMVESETDKYYHIRFLEYHADGRRPGTLSRVRKNKVTLDAPEVKDAPPIRLPYKDNGE